MSGAASLTAGFLLGMSTGPVCLGTCLPMLFPFAVSELVGSTKSRRWAFLGKFLVGRLLAYTATGAIASVASRQLGSASSRIGLYAWLGLSLLLIAYGAGARMGHIGLCPGVIRRNQGAVFPFTLGILTGLSICPPFLLALSYLVEQSNSMASGVSFFVAFFCATTIYILPIGFLGHIPRSERLDLIGKIAAIAAGAFFFCKASLLLIRFN